MSSLLFFLFINFNCIFEDVLIGCIRCNQVFGANIGSIAGFRLGLYLCSAVYNRALGPFDFCAAGWTCHRCPFHVVELCATLSAKVFSAPLWFCQCVPLISETNIHFAALCHERVLLSKQKEYSALSRIYRLPVLENLVSDVDAALNPND